jgi:2-haloacid dehalogenase
MGKFDIILWDVDQTLLDFKKSESYAIRFCFRKFGKEASDETVSAYSSINENFWKQIEKGQINKKEALVERFRTLFRQIGEEDIEAEAFQKEYADALGSVYYFQDDSYNLLNQLKGKYRQYLVTNGVTYTQMKKLRLSGLDKLVDGIFVSEQLGVPKPHKEFFEQCFCAIPGFQREKALIVGDSLSSDMQGGNNAQISTCWYNPAGLENPFNIRIDYQIKDLNEIWNVLEDMAD